MGFKMEGEGKGSMAFDFMESVVNNVHVQIVGAVKDDDGVLKMWCV